MTMTSSADKHTFQFPRNYEVLEILGEGGFGQVVKCLKRDTGQTVAVKVLKQNQAAKREISMLNKIKCLNFDQCNIVRYFGSFPVGTGKALVFEELDISLYDYLVKTDCTPMLLSDVRNIIRQMATALNALKSIGVIHTDIKPDNIMLVNRESQPLEAKLIDFGLALPREKVHRGKTFSTVEHRSPEILLGLPVSEATDMWSLGCVMATMLIGGSLILADTPYEALRRIVDTVGKLPDHLLNDGLWTPLYFTKTCSDSWRFSAPKDFGRNHYPSDQTFSLEDMKEMCQKSRNEAEVEERLQCLDLLKAMLKLDAAERITPTEVLAHPFINNGLHSPTMACNIVAEKQQASEDPDCEPAATALKDHTSNTQQDHTGSAPTIPKTSVTNALPTPTDTKMENKDGDDSLQKLLSRVQIMLSLASSNEELDREPPATAVTDVLPTTTGNKPETEYEAGDDSLQNLLSMAEKMLSLSSSSEELDREPPTTVLKDKDNSSNQSDHFSAIIPKSEVIIRTGEEEDKSGEKETEGKEEAFHPSGPKKQKKNRFRRFCSWMKKTFCCCWTCPMED